MTNKEAIEIITAYDNGKTIERKFEGKDWERLPKGQNIEWNFSDFHYRIANIDFEDTIEKMKAYEKYFPDYLFDDYIKDCCNDYTPDCVKHNIKHALKYGYITACKDYQKKYKNKIDIFEQMFNIK